MKAFANKTPRNVMQIKMYLSIPEKKDLINDIMNSVKSQKRRTEK